MKKLILITLVAFSTFFYSCGSGDNESSTTSGTTETAEPELPQSIAEGKGVGEITEVNLEDELDPNMVKMGSAIYDMKC